MMMRFWAAPVLAALMVMTPASAAMMASGAAIKLGIGARPAAMHAVLMNHGDTPRKLMGAHSPAFERIELHTHEKSESGMMSMRQVTHLDVPAQGVLSLKPGGDHLMLFGFTGAPGDTVEVTLTFDGGAPVSLRVPTRARAKYQLKQTPSGHHGH